MLNVFALPITFFANIARDSKVRPWRSGSRLAATVVAALACAGAAAQNTQINYVGYAGGPINLIEHIAIEKGIFATHGLDVKFLGVTGGQQSAAALVGGSAQFGMVITSSAVPLASQDQCIRYMNADARSFYNLIAQADMSLPNAGKPFPAALVDLKGKKVGIPVRGGVAEFVMDAVLKEAGLKPGDITYIVTGGAATGVASFRARQIDALITFPPQEQMLKGEEFKRVAKITDAKEHNPTSNLTQAFSGTTCDYAKANPKTVDQYCKAIADSFKYVNDPVNRAGVVGVLQKVMSIDAATAGSFWDQYNKTWPTGKIDKAAWDQQKLIIPAGIALPSYESVVSESCQAKL